MRRLKPLVEISSGGWLTKESDMFHILVEQEPPRRFSHLEMFLQDIHEPKLWRWWAQIVFWLGLGILGINAEVNAFYALFAFAFAVYLGVCYLFLLRGMVGTIRHKTVCCATVTQAESQPRWWGPEQVVLHVVTADGKKARVSLGIAESLRTLEKHGAIEVLFLQPAGAGEAPSRNPESSFLGFAYRPAPKGIAPDQPECAPGATLQQS